MTKYKYGDVVLVEFVFSETTQYKKRPALVLSSDQYNNDRQEVIIAGITSNIERVLVGDTKINKWKESGLLFQSLAAGIIQTIKSTLISRKLGVLSSEDLYNVQRNLQKVLFC